MPLIESRPRSRHEETPTTTIARLRHLLDVGTSLSLPGGPGRPFCLLAQTTTDVLQCEAASILLLDETTGALRFEAATGAAGAALRGTEVPLHNSLAGVAFRENRTVCAADAEADVRRYRETDRRTGFVTRTVIGAPVRIGSQPVGVVQAVNARRGAFDESDAEALLIVSGQVARAIQGARHEAALQRAHARLADLDRLKDNFMSIASHELRTPITAVCGYAEMLAEDYGGEVREHAEAIARAGDRMIDVVETLDVLAGLQGDLGQHPGVLTSLAAVLRESVGEAAPDAEVSLPPGPLLVEGDARRLRLAFVHLLRNAVQFSAPGGLVRLAVDVADGTIRVAVLDHGRGIAAGDLDAVFDAYVQVADPDRRDHEGLGVGLTVARAVLVQHGGRLWAESPGLGQGATFHARLPLAAPA